MTLNKKIIVIIVAGLYIVLFLNPAHYRPWAGFLSEFLAFISLLVLFFIFLNKKILVPKLLIPIFLIALIPIFQFFSGQIYYFQKAILASIYIFSFCIACSMTYTICDKDIESSKKVMQLISITFMIAGMLSAYIAIIQWLGLVHDSEYILNLVGNRPYANMAQPNHLATLLTLSLLSCLYLFEQKKNTLFLLIISIILIFTIALTQSRTTWLVSLFILIFYWVKSKSIQFRLPKNKILIWFLTYVFIIFSLPTLNYFLGFYYNISQTNTVVERASSGYLRLQIWDQMLHAIIQKPIWGYGWNQTTAAQYSVIDQVYGHEWASSAHNIILDIIVWCGLPMGLIITGYLFYIYFTFLIRSKSSETIVATLMISAVVIHSLLEYPLYYSYFLLPVGLLCGVILSETSHKSLKIPLLFNWVLIVFSFFGIGYIFTEYNKISDNMIAANTHEMNDLKTELVLPYPIPFFDMFNARAQWIALYPYSKVSHQELNQIRKMVQTYLTPYDLHKFAKLLAFNGHKEEAIRQLTILKIMYNQNYSYESLFVKETSVKKSYSVAKQ
ncbi:O-antigen ligase C-terminal domain-containing protein [Acinetobacter sp. S40]|uniref:PglL family O-oligosaccharyltransferase n=1 Tax=Acinetobacter sp. S40 TaxID=2767434 RepID=UPI00190C4CFB|nr:O-antigen ligase family protein [Acinetobacter sp. S40]MBJ9984093.1 O-antigen ligase C-terminal domain-containing protein [Acinetobacter sp. S40]